MPNRRPHVDAAELEGGESVHTLLSVARDFAALVSVFENQLQLLSERDDEARLHLVNAKAAAERGLQLSEDLLKRIQSKG